MAVEKFRTTKIFGHKKFRTVKISENIFVRKFYRPKFFVLFFFCSIYDEVRNDLFRSLNTFLPNFINLSDTKKTNILLYGDESLNHDANKHVLLSTLNYLKETKRFCS